MATKWTKKKISPDINGEYSQINNGNEYEIDDAVAIEELNAIVNNSLYASDVAEQSINIAQQALNQTIADGINPNLLINGDFRVNQRRQNSYSGNNIYGVDRWKLINTINSVVVNENSISITFGGQFRALGQYVEDFKKLKGKTLTLSCKVKNITGIVYLRAVRTNTVATSTPITTPGIFTHTFTVEEEADRLVCQLFTGTSAGADYGIEVEYMKLEIGSIATPYSPRPYAEELPMSMRYYQIRSNTYSIEANAIDRPIPTRVNGTVGTTVIDGITYNTVDAEIY